MNALARRLDVNEREIPGFPGYYATLDGVIISRKRAEIGLKPRAHRRTGHLRVRLYVASAPLREHGGTRRNGTRSRARFVDAYVHVLVCLAWHGPPPFAGALVLHLDDDPQNNRPENLRWGTVKQNAQHREMDDEEQLAAARVAWAEFNPGIDEDGFNWNTGEWK